VPRTNRCHPSQAQPSRSQSAKTAARPGCVFTTASAIERSVGWSRRGEETQATTSNAESKPNSTAQGTASSRVAAFRSADFDGLEPGGLQASTATTTAGIATAT
jgi:hypothetical protein